MPFLNFGFVLYPTVPGCQAFFNASPLAEHDEADLSARMAAGGAVRKEEILPAGGTESDGKNIFGRHPRLPDLEAVGKGEINHPAVLLQARTGKKTRVRHAGKSS